MSSRAKGSLVLGLIGFWVPYGGLVLGAAGAWMGHSALAQIRAGMFQGHGTALLGLTLSYITAAMHLVLIVN